MSADAQPETAVPVADERSADQLEADIARTREEIGRTVHALTEKLDIKTRMQHSARDLKTRAASRAHGMKTRGRGAIRTAMSAASDSGGSPKRPAPIGLLVAAAAAGTAVATIVWAHRR